MATQNRQQTLTHLNEKLPRLSVDNSGDSLWLNLWCGFDTLGKRQHVARTKVDDRIFNSAETDYHEEKVSFLLKAFSEIRDNEIPTEVVQAAPKAKETVADKVVKTAKKVTKRKTTKASK